MTKLLIKLLALLGTKVVVLPEEVLTEYATREITSADSIFPEQSGEYKRHVVYAKLIKKFPETPKRQIALAIELALNVQA